MECAKKKLKDYQRGYENIILFDYGSLNVDTLGNSGNYKDLPNAYVIFTYTLTLFV